ncbi:uncharacterized protein RCC_04087 [Ramularia collo-cygni]|uniref:Zn(2)-C6 fungal-type domain-containing protein n=1 Tax=Ramularia collo-cygni TaxID=112498 RepID=A0A2D3UP83_9PEZI|nr:uncharacterized protein RCC_04087 [Ramularia collo-cygni]CZT18242.1 uncharacterized protein RCC_04087 [Ramularia collo-cygni]
MNHNDAPPYPAYTQQYGYPPSAVTYAPTQPPYPYPTQLPQNPAQQQQQHHLQQQQQQPPPHFFQSLPQGTSRQIATPTRRQQQHIPGNLQNGNRSIPPTPGHGPGAPPPEHNSPPGVNYEEALMDALRRENDAGASSNTVNNGNAGGNVHEDDDDDEDEQMNDDIDEPVYQLPPPPEAVYPNEIELENAMHAWSLEHGYELVRRASKRNAAKQLYKRYFHCSKHGKVSHKAVRKEDRKRINRTSNRMNCPMSLAAVAVDPHDPSGNWQIRHRKTYHNHPAVDVVHLAGHRRRARNPAVEAAVDGLFAIGTNVGDVLKFLQKTNPDGLFKRTDVANMKLKFKKFGTCAQGSDEQPQGARSIPGASSTTCSACRVKKTKCNNARPICDVCASSDTPCHYDTPADPGLEEPRDGDMTTLSQNLDTTASSQSGPGLNALHAERVLAALNSFQQEHIRPTRLTLESSAVEILAASTCGNGESYRNALGTRTFGFGDDYASFKEAFLSAAMKENTRDVLIGVKREPSKPTVEEGEEVSVEEWNEYVKQLAIYKRRDDMLKAALRESTTKVLWARISRLEAAREMWSAIEDLCRPRGSDEAFARFSALQEITLEGSRDFETYVFDMRRKWEEFNEMAACHEARRAPAQLNQSSIEISKRREGGDGTFSEEMLCFLFLRNLGGQYQGLAANMSKRHNIGGYGSGERVTFKELALLVRRGVEGDGSRGRGVR